MQDCPLNTLSGGRETHRQKPNAGQTGAIQLISQFDVVNVRRANEFPGRAGSAPDRNRRPFQQTHARIKNGLGFARSMLGEKLRTGQGGFHRILIAPFPTFQFDNGQIGVEMALIIIHLRQFP